MNPQDHAHRATIQVLHTPIHAQEDRCMSYSPQIADAKRRARASARTTGTSYQSELENEAKALGYERWSDLISGDSPENAQDSHKKDPDSGGHRDLRAIRLTAGRLCSKLGKRAVLTMASIAMILAIGASASVMRPSDDQQIRWGNSLLYEEEREISATLPGLEFAEYRRLSYVVAREISPRERGVHIAIYDWKSVISLRNLIDPRSTYRAPAVLRYEGTVECDTGIFRSPNVYGADNLITKPYMAVTTDAIDEQLSESEVDVICSEDTLRKTEKIESLYLKQGAPPNNTDKGDLYVEGLVL